MLCLSHHIVNSMRTGIIFDFFFHTESPLLSTVPNTELEFSKELVTDQVNE